MDHRADIFAMGIILWEMLANRRLFLGRDERETLDLVRAAKVPSLKSFNKEVDDELEKIVKKALARDPKKRISTAAQFVDMLSEYLFKKELKVNSHDLKNFLLDIFEEKEEDDSVISHAIGTMIQDEILSLSMVKYEGKPMPLEGKDPIKLEEITYSGEDKIREEEIFGDDVDFDTASGETHTDALEAIEGSDALKSSSNKSSNSMLWVGIFLFVLILLGLGGYFLFTSL